MARWARSSQQLSFPNKQLYGVQYIEGDMYSHLDSAAGTKFIHVAFNYTFIGCICLLYIQSEYVKVPSTETEWVGVSRDFEQYGTSPTAFVWITLQYCHNNNYNTSTIAGAVDCKHVVML